MLFNQKSDRRQMFIGFVIIFIIVEIILLAIHAKWLALILLILCVVIAIKDRFQKKRSLLRNFPLIGHVRYIAEMFKPEIRQYFIVGEDEEIPFDRETRSLIYQRAKNVETTVAFGTSRNLYMEGMEFISHSIAPKTVNPDEVRVLVGGEQCKKPYLASRLNISAMSFGSLSKNAQMALNQGAKMGGFAHNTGEGGLSSYHLQGGDIVLQIGTGYFGVRDQDGKFDPESFKEVANIPEVKMIEVKISQGAKPGRGGILPAEKLTEEIARIRKVPMGKDVVSPSSHTAFTTPLGLLKFLQQLRELSGGKPVGFKLCVGRKSEFLGICKAILESGILPDFITIDGAEGGTGATLMEFANYVGMPLRDGLIFAHNALTGTGLRKKIRLISSGKLGTSFDMLVNLATGADLCNSARGMMLALGCIQSRQCDKNTCPVGVATQNESLNKGLVVEEKRIRVYNFHRFTMKGVLDIAGVMGLTSLSALTPQMINRRINEYEISNYADLYKYVAEGSLLGADIPESFRSDWQAATSESF